MDERYISNFWRGISSNVLSKEGLNICAQYDNDFFYYPDCVMNIQKFKPPWFGYNNGGNTYLCQSYLEVLKDLTLVEKVVIAGAHLIITIIELRPSG